MYQLPAPRLMLTEISQIRESAAAILSPAGREATSRGSKVSPAECFPHMPLAPCIAVLWFAAIGTFSDRTFAVDPTSQLRIRCEPCTVHRAVSHPGTILTIVFWSNSCQATRRCRTLVMIGEETAEPARPLRTYSSQNSRLRGLTCQSPLRILSCRLASNLGGNLAFSRSSRQCRRMRRRPKCSPKPNQNGEEPQPGARPPKYLPPNSVACAP